MKVKLINYTPEPEKTIAMAAKICYSPVGTDEIEKKLTEEGIKKFIKMITDIGHGSVLEHVNFTFAIEGISRACSHQLVRHRIASYSQQSQRYVQLKDTFKFINPPAIAEDESIQDFYNKAMSDVFESYIKITKRLLEGKIKKFLKSRQISLTSDRTEWEKIMLRDYKKEYKEFEKEAIEDARYVLPNACETKIVVTMNARSLFNFFQHRCCERAQWEIRDLATEMLREVKKVAPILFGKAGASCVNGGCPEGNMSCGKINEVRDKLINL